MYFHKKNTLNHHYLESQTHLKCGFGKKHHEQCNVNLIMWIDHLNSKNSHFSYHCGGKNSKYIVEIHNPFKSCSTIKDRVGLGFFIFSFINLILLIIFYLFFFFNFFL
jgi:hypothetical protein